MSNLLAKRVHHDVLLDHLPTFLWELGKGLADSGSPNAFHHSRPAGAPWVTNDGKRAGPSEEVVRDYQLLGVIVIEHLHETVDRSLTTHEVMALGVILMMRSLAA